MKHVPRILTIVAILFALSLFIFPMWSITLTAPQYPEGVSMYIWINQITGDTPSTLQNINILNHYVGMKYIEPDSIPELTYFPFIVIGIAVMLLVSAIANNKYVYVSAFAVYLVLAGLGIYDFYLWEYDYGNNLDPKAPIKIPGQSYQPPLFGTQYLLNFKADSYPATGGILMGISILFMAIASFFRWKQQGKAHAKSKVQASGAWKMAMPILLLFATACSKSPEPIQYGEEACAFCKMTIVDKRYGSELVSTKGKVFKFDAVECMINYQKQHKDTEWEHQLVTSYKGPGKLIPAENTYVIRSKELPSPMGAYLTVLPTEGKAKVMKQNHGGEIYPFAQVKKNFKELPQP